MFWYFGKIKKYRKNTFEYDLNHFVYDSIWLNMMYIIEKWCLKWFPCKVSHENIQNTMKYEEILRTKWKNQKNLSIFAFYPMKWCAPKLKICMHDLFDVPDSNLMPKPPNKNKFYMILMILLNFHFDIFWDFWNKTEIAE